MQLRVTTGTAKNKKLEAPDIPGYRAVQEIAKSAVFSIIGDKIKDSLCLDLFAGSGNLGIEALSRGASYCDFVDGESKSADVIKSNLEKCGFTDKSAVYLKNAVKFAASTGRSYDFVFMDPFYNDTAQQHLLNLIRGILKDDGILFYFHSTDENVEEMAEKAGMKITDSRTFGQSTFSIIKLS